MEREGRYGDKKQSRRAGKELIMEAAAVQCFSKLGREPYARAHSILTYNLFFMKEKTNTF